MQLIDCKTLAADVLKNVAAQHALLPFRAKLAIINIGDNEASRLYIKNKVKVADSLDILTSVFEFSSTERPETVAQLIAELNEDEGTHGIIVQLPAILNNKNFSCLTNLVSPVKDVDCLNQVNIGKLFHHHTQPTFRPCSVLAVNAILRSLHFELRGKNVVIINDGILIGKPLAAFILNHGGTPTICHKNTNCIPQFTSTADLIITAVGKPEFQLGCNWLSGYDFDRAIPIIDFGINLDKEGKIYGDVNVNTFKHGKAIITKVPGVGSLVVSCLLYNLMAACQIQC